MNNHIPSDELERLKREVSLVRLVEARGVALKRHGKDWIGRCPFHADKSPSFVVSPDKNLWHCLGACQVGGSVIDFVMKAQSVTFLHAVEILREEPLLVAMPSSAAKRSTIRKLSSPLKRDAEDSELLGQVSDYYHQRLKQTPEALKYLDKRGLGGAELIEKFRIGFVDRTLGLRLPCKDRKEGSELRGRLHKLGLVRSTGHELLGGCVVFPIRDEYGQVANLYGRRIAAVRHGASEHLYLDGPRGGVLNVEGFALHGGVILCEAVIDALSFWVAGLRNVTTAWGINGFTEELMAALLRQRIERVLIAYDRDQAGDEAAVRLATQLCSAGIDAYRIQFPQNMDANDLLVAAGSSAAKKYGELIRKAICIGQASRVQLLTEKATQSTSTCVAENAMTLPQTTPSESPCLLAAEPPESAVSANSAAKPVVDAEVRDDEAIMHFGDRRWRVRGWAKSPNHDQLKVNVLASRGDAFHVDTFDLYSARHRQAYTKEAAAVLEVEEDIVRRDLGRVLFKLEELQEQHLRLASESPSPRASMSSNERDEALAALRDPKLTERILADFERCGVVGEEDNKLVCYLATVSRQLEAPLAVVIQSSSAAGKSSVMESVLAFVPEEDRVKYSAMTGQSLFYMGETDIKHKVLAIAEEAGAERAAYALKLLQSEGELTIASTGKDPQTGRMVTHTYRVEGPTAIMLTTTAVEVDEELLNRCLVLSVSEERDQTQAIHRVQRRQQTLEGLVLRQERSRILSLHHNMQRLLRPLWVSNPYAEQLTFTDDRTRSRRDQMKYLTLIRAIALLHQHQRPVRTVEVQGERLEYIEVTVDDIALANRLASRVMGRSLDELPPQTRRFLGLLYEMVTNACAELQIEPGDYRFLRRQIRQTLGWSYEQVRVHLGRLVELEYVLAHRGGRGQQFVYELLYDGQGADGASFLTGLIDVQTLRTGAEAVVLEGSSITTTRTLGGSQAHFGVGYRPHTGPLPGGYRGAENDKNPMNIRTLSDYTAPTNETTVLRSPNVEPAVVVISGPSAPTSSRQHAGITDTAAAAAPGITTASSPTEAVAERLVRKAAG